jgi:hypothetical protein
MANIRQLRYLLMELQPPLLKVGDAIVLKANEELKAGTKLIPVLN